MRINGIEVATRILEGPGHLNFLTHRGEVKALPGDVIITFPGDITFVCPYPLATQLEVGDIHQGWVIADDPGDPVEQASQKPKTQDIVGPLTIDDIKTKAASGVKLTDEEEMRLLEGK